MASSLFIVPAHSISSEIPMDIGIKPEWADIPIEIAAKICEHIELYDDYEAFSMVCSCWRLASKEFRCQYTQLPWLMLVHPNDSSYIRYYSLTKLKYIKIDLPPLLSPTQTRRYFSTRGWVVSVTRNISNSVGSNNYYNITIFNPSSNNNVIIEAPLFHICEDENYGSVPLFAKFAISTSPYAKDTDDFVVAMIFGKRQTVAYWRLGHDDDWVVPDLHNGLFQDLCFFRGELYATKYLGLTTLTQCRVIAFGDFKDHQNSRPPRVVACLGPLLTNMDLDDIDIESNYVVESKNDESDQAHTSSLFIIRRHIVINAFKMNKARVRTWSFNVFKLNVDNRNVENVKSLGNQAIFVGFNSTFSINVDDVRGCKADCIYYTDDYMRSFGTKENGRGSDMGIYSLREGNTLPFYEGQSLFSYVNPPTWIELSSA